MKRPHLVLFDNTCNFCCRSVDKIKSWDHNKRFSFSPLLGNTAKEVLKGQWPKYKDANTLILIENYRSPHSQLWIKGRAVMRIFWLLGGAKRLIGWLAFVPFGVDQVYNFIAKRRHRF